MFLSKFIANYLQLALFYWNVCLLGKLYTKVFCSVSFTAQNLLYCNRPAQIIVHRCSNQICFMLFHHVSLITLCWQLLSTERYKPWCRQTGLFSVFCACRWCVRADVCNVLPEISRTSGKKQLYELMKRWGVLSFYSLVIGNISNSKIFYWPL